MTTIETRLLENQMMMLHALRHIMTFVDGAARTTSEYNALKLAIEATHKVLHEPEKTGASD